MSDDLCEKHYPLAAARRRHELALDPESLPSTRKYGQLHETLCATATSVECLRSGKSTDFYALDLPKALCPRDCENFMYVDSFLTSRSEYGYGCFVIANNKSIDGKNLAA